MESNVKNYDLASHILNSNGLSNRESYYSGIGVDDRTLNKDGLVSIFMQLLKLDKSYALEFVEMVKKMKTLGASEFISTFKEFVANGFSTEHLKMDDDFYYVDELDEKKRSVLAIISVDHILRRNCDIEEQIRLSNNMKYSFLLEIAPILMEINQEFNYKEVETYYSEEKTKTI